jgi:hypothetical protein
MGGLARRVSVGYWKRSGAYIVVLEDAVEDYFAERDGAIGRVVGPLQEAKRVSDPPTRLTYIV